VKLNCDLGEGNPAVDTAIMPYIDMANIACGGHASDAKGMQAAVDLALQHNVLIGAHPSYADKANFGRIDQELTTEETERLVTSQVNALQEICLAKGSQVSYVKPHGALYNRMMRDEVVLKAILIGINKVQPNLPLMVLARRDNSAIESIANDFKTPLIQEVFCDRGYKLEGSLVPRGEKGALLNSDQITKRINDLINRDSLETVCGEQLNIKADTLCVHGDDAHALQSVIAIRQMLSESN